MTVFLCALIIIALGAIGALCTGRSPALSSRIGMFGCAAGCVVGLVQPLAVIGGLQSGCVMTLPWNMPLGRLTLAIDSLSAWFLIPVFLVCLLAALYGREYLQDHGNGSNIGMHWMFYDFLVIGMALVVTAGNGLLFLLAWEIMSLASFFLVCFEHEDTQVSHAGWVYFVATHIGSAFLITMFLILGRQCGTLDFNACVGGGIPSTVATVVFLLALIGFGAKAGFLPFHVWLPLAHPAAPSHVSAVMSGVMIKMGIYGLLRILTLIGPPHAWWAIVLIAVGAASGILGVLYALGQHDLKRLLAYHSVENIGIITLGIGLGMVGVCQNMPVIAFLGFGGGMLHVVNHGIFKSLLFLGAGSVVKATGTREIDRLGGVLKNMPLTGMGFLTGSIAICGLPPLNGFISEFLIYFGSVSGALTVSGLSLMMLLGVVLSLALIGGLAVACFTKAFGVVFLGEPRTSSVATREAGALMTVPMIILSLLCVVLGVGAFFMVPVLRGPVNVLMGSMPDHRMGDLSTIQAAMNGVSIGVVVFIALAAAVVLARNRLLAGRTVRRSPTWDCGYTRPAVSMQYTASSFTAPIIVFFGYLLSPRSRNKTATGYFPASWTFHSQVPDVYLDRLYAPVFRMVERALARLRWLQGGRVHVYVLYIALALLGLLVWKLVVVR